MEQTTATSVDTTVDEPSIAVDTVDEPSTAVDKSPHIDGNDESDDEVPTFDVDWDGIRHNILHASQPLNEVVKPINKIIQHGKHITNLRKLLQNQHDGCCQFAEQEGLVQEGLVQESPVQKGHAEEGCDLPDHEGGLVRFNKETSELLSKAVGWDKEMDTVKYHMAQTLDGTAQEIFAIQVYRNKKAQATSARNLCTPPIVGFTGASIHPPLAFCRHRYCLILYDTSLADPIMGHIIFFFHVTCTDEARINSGSPKLILSSRLQTTPTEIHIQASVAIDVPQRAYQHV
ncbi:hypothetical protein Q9189_004909 [Teloschistes chrysophthalmus]